MESAGITNLNIFSLQSLFLLTVTRSKKSWTLTLTQACKTVSAIICSLQTGFPCEILIFWWATVVLCNSVSRTSDSILVPVQIPIPSHRRWAWIWIWTCSIRSPLLVKTQFVITLLNQLFQPVESRSDVPDFRRTPTNPRLARIGEELCSRLASTVGHGTARPQQRSQVHSGNGRRQGLRVYGGLWRMRPQLHYHGIEEKLSLPV